MYLFNATAFNLNTMKWAVVARVRANKENFTFYQMAFNLMFSMCRKDCPQFKLEKYVKGIIVDWCDTKAKGLRDAIGQNLADKLLRGCNLHWARSYQRVADKLNSRVQKGNRKIANEAFCIVAKHVTMAKTKGDVLRLFDVLWRSYPISS